MMPKGNQTAASKKRKLPPDFSELGKATVIIRVGRKDFTVHKNLACHFSPFLSAAFNGSFIEGQSHFVNLHDTTTGAVALCVRWIYTGKLEDRSRNPPDDQADLINLALLADKLLMPELQNETIREILKTSIRQNIIQTPMSKTVYENTVVGHPLRKVLSEITALCLEEETMEENAAKRPDIFPQEMLYDMIIALRKKHGNVALRDLDVEKFMVEIPEDNGERAAGRKGA